MQQNKNQADTSNESVLNINKDSVTNTETGYIYTDGKQLCAMNNE